MSLSLIVIPAVFSGNSNNLPQAHANQFYTQYSDDFWLRSPGLRSEGPGKVSSSGTVYASGNDVLISRAVRPAMFISLQSLANIKENLTVGVCSSNSPTDNDSSCVKITVGSNIYLFNIIGINSDGSIYNTNTQAGICSITDTSGYLATGVSGVGATTSECPTNSVFLLLSNQSPTKPANSMFCGPYNSGSYCGADAGAEYNSYNNSSNQILFAVQSFYANIQTGTIAGTLTALQPVVIPRSLAGGAAANSGTGNCNLDSCDVSTGFPNNMSGPALENQSALLLSALEAGTLRGYTGSDTVSLIQQPLLCQWDNTILASDVNCAEGGQNSANSGDNASGTAGEMATTAETGVGAGVLGFALLALLGGGATLANRRRFFVRG